MKLNFPEKSLNEFTAALGSKEPVPGGGGACALAGALSASLCLMVGNFTLGKKKYEAVEEDVKRMMGEAEELRLGFLRLIDEDGENFEPLSRAYALPKDAPGRDEVMESCLLRAAAAPMEIMRLCCRLGRLHEEMGRKGSAIMLSDVATGVCLARAAMEGALANVKVNTGLMKNRDVAAAMEEEAEKMIEGPGSELNGVYEKLLMGYNIKDSLK